MKNKDIELTWDNAYKWEEEANCGKEIFNEPKWAWDCNFKLDFDGSLLSLSSRFYPPHKHSGTGWVGNFCITLMGKEILTKELKGDTLDELKKNVEDFKQHYIGIVKSKLT